MKYLFFCIIFLFLSFSLTLSQELIEAVKSQNIEKVKQLLASGTDVDQEDSTGRTGIIWAAKNGDSSMVNLLIEHKADINVYNDSMLTPLMESAGRGYYRLCQILLQNGAKIGRAVKIRYEDRLRKERTALQLAVELKYIDIVRLLLDNGADIDEQTTNYIEIEQVYGYNKSTISNFSVLGDTPLLIAVAQGKLDMVNFLIERKADLEIQTEMLNVNNRLKQGPAVGNLQLFNNLSSLLVTYRSANIKPIKNDNALMLAVKNNDSAITSVLIKAGAEIDAEGSYSINPLTLAVLNDNIPIATMLLQQGADANHLTGPEKTPIISFGAMTNDTDMVKLLLQYKARINEQSRYERSALGIASELGHLTMIKFLIAHHADVNLSDNKNETPLMVASRGPCVECVQALVLSSADITKTNVNNQTALAIAIKAGKQEIIDFLVRVGAKESYETEE